MRVGKTNKNSTKSSTAKNERDLKRDHRVRDYLNQAFRKSRDELMAVPVNGPQYRKFSVGEFVVHRLGDTVYPKFDDNKRISNWLKFEMFDFYFNGIEGILDIKYALVSEHTRACFINRFGLKLETSA